jgi:hypothetical protein
MTRFVMRRIENEYGFRWIIWDQEANSEVPRSTVVSKRMAQDLARWMNEKRTAKPAAEAAT